MALQSIKNAYIHERLQKPDLVQSVLFAQTQQALELGDDHQLLRSADRIQIISKNNSCDRRKCQVYLMSTSMKMDAGE
jgi:hypothetical protein